MKLSGEFVASAILTMVLLVLDKAGKLNPLLLLVLLLACVVLAIIPAWQWASSSAATNKMKVVLRTSIITGILLFFALVAWWIWPYSPKQQTYILQSSRASVPPVAPSQSRSIDIAPPQRTATNKHKLSAGANFAQPTQVISAPNGIAIGGGTVANPTVNNYASPKPPELRVTQDGNKITLSAMGGSISPVSVAFVFSGPVTFEGGVPRACMMCGSARRRGANGIEDPRTVWVFWRMPPLTPGDDVSFTYTPVEGYVSLVAYKEVPIPY